MFRILFEDLAELLTLGVFLSMVSVWAQAFGVS
jgi:hypothetical protein